MINDNTAVSPPTTVKIAAINSNNITDRYKSNFKICWMKIAPA